MGTLEKADIIINFSLDLSDKVKNKAFQIEIWNSEQEKHFKVQFQAKKAITLQTYTTTAFKVGCSTQLFFFLPVINILDF